MYVWVGVGVGVVVGVGVSGCMWVCLFGCMCGYIMQTLIIDRYRQHGIGFPTIFNTTRPHTAIDVYISTN